MDKLIITGLGSLDGTIDFDIEELLANLTNREIHRIKTMSGVRLGELMDALGAGDNDVLIALAAILLAQRGKRFDEDQLWDAPAGSGIAFDLADREGDAGPPELATV